MPLDELYKQMFTSNRPMNPFLSTDESTGETVWVWTLFSHAGVYVIAIGLLIPAGLGIFCCYFFWCQPARLVHWPLQSGSMQYTVVDDNVEAASHLQMWWQGWTTYSKTSQESWPAFWMRTYTDGESTEATGFIQSSSCIQNIGCHQNPGNAIRMYGLL